MALPVSLTHQAPERFYPCVADEFVGRFNIPTTDGITSQKWGTVVKAISMIFQISSKLSDDFPSLGCLGLYAAEARDAVTLFTREEPAKGCFDPFRFRALPVATPQNFNQEKDSVKHKRVYG
jgi:hypothetical protein